MHLIIIHLPSRNLRANESSCPSQSLEGLCMGSRHIWMHLLDRTAERLTTLIWDSWRWCGEVLIYNTSTSSRESKHVVNPCNVLMWRDLSILMPAQWEIKQNNCIDCQGTWNAVHHSESCRLVPIHILHLLGSQAKNSGGDLRAHAATSWWRVF